MTAARSAPPAARSARDRVRAELTAEILGAATDELSLVGPTALSLRAVARRLGMVPSALYRYFPSRHALLTGLIIQAYQAVGGAAEEAAGRTSGGLPGWLAVGRAVRDWAHAHPQQWALIYGSPVPGYRAPDATVQAALRITEVVAGLVREAAGHPLPGALPSAVELEPVVEPMRALLLPGRSPETVIAALMIWTSLIGMVSLELFGHYEGATTDFEAVFVYAMEASGRMAGLA